jgi:hypothetical protein
MKDISYHILDIAQNAIHAGADRIETEICDNLKTGTFSLRMADNGKGMSREESKRATDPFYTTKEKKKVGLGLPLLKQHAEQTGGSFRLESAERLGTTVTATFASEHLDMLPLGDLGMTLKILIASNPGIRFLLRYRTDGDGFDIDTEEIRRSLETEGPFSNVLLNYIAEFIRDNLKKERMPEWKKII